MTRHDQRGVRHPRIDAEVTRRIAEAVRSTKENRMTTTAQLLNAIWTAAKEQPTDVSQTAADHGIETDWARQVLSSMRVHKLLSFDEDAFEYTAIEEVSVQQVQTVLQELGNPDKEPSVASAKPTPAPRRTGTPSNPVSSSSMTDCLCGCGERVAGKANYKPGHDARHAGQVARAVVEAKTRKDANSVVQSIYATLPSEKLQAKAEAIATKMLDKISTKAAQPK